ncbi:aldehyde dehydrogenase family protein [Vagococcus sp. JNUCC 83]
MTQIDLKSILSSQRHFFDTNQTKELTFRKEQLTNLKKSLIKYEEAIYWAFEKDLHKCSFETYYTEYGLVLSSIDSMIKNMDKWLKPKIVKPAIHSFLDKTTIYKEPFGIVYIIGPFNYPLQLIMIPLIGALASGNCAVVRPSKRTPNIATVIDVILTDAFNSHYVKSINPMQVPNKDVLAYPFDFIFFTGSSSVGKIILEAASKNLTPCVLELGGKSPSIITDDANISHAAQQIVWSKFLNAGQTCIATDYVLVNRGNLPLLIDEIKKQIIALYGQDIRHNKDYGRPVDQVAFNRLIHLLKDNQEEIIVGGSYDITVNFIEPALFQLPLNRNSSLMKEEIFGPLLPILIYDTLDEAIGFVKLGDKPLAAYLFSDNKDYKKRFVEELSFGGGGINQTILQISNEDTPFGGVGTSGMGNYHGQYSIQTFSHEKTILHANQLTQTFESLIMPPYTAKKWKILKDILN